MSDLLLVEQTTPSNPSAAQRLIYAKSDGRLYTKDAAGNERRLVHDDGAVAGLTGRNAIIGGDFSTNPWQRGTSSAAVAAGTYLADRWVWEQSGTGVVDISKLADAPTVAQAGRLTNHSLLVDVTTADAAIAIGDLYTVIQTVEGYNFLPLAQRPMTLSFWHKHTKTGIYCTSLRNSSGDRSFVAEYTQAVSDTWELATIVISASPSAGTWNYTNGTGLNVDFTLVAGTNFQTTPGAWQVGNFLVTANQINGMDNVANNFRIALVQLEAGSVATSFEGRTVQDELALCQRYYAKTFPIGTAPAQAAGAIGVLGSDFAYGAAAGVVAVWNFPVRMRATPTITTYNPTQANANWRNSGNTADATRSFGQSGDARAIIQADTDTVAGNRYEIHAAASAEL